MNFIDWTLIYWTPLLVEVPYEFGSFRPFFCPFVRPFVYRFLTQYLRIRSLVFFPIFCQKLDSHKVRKEKKPDFLKKADHVREPKKPQTWPKIWNFQGFDIHSYVVFHLNRKVLVVF